MNFLKKYQYLLLIFLAYIIVFVYYPVIKNSSFFCLDDFIMVTDNVYITSLSWNNIVNIFHKAYYYLYHPLVTISFAVEYHLFGLDPYIYHVNNVLLHILNTFLVFFVFLKLTKSEFKAFFISLFFAVYPTNVEVVAWISSRKDLLFCFFYLLSIVCYMKNYDNKKNIFYFMSIIFFLATCFSKPMSVTLPIVIILIDFLKNRLFKQNIKKYIPFFIISISFSILTLKFYYNDTSVIGLPLFDYCLKLLNVHFYFLFYIFKAMFPFYLSGMYPAFYSHSMPPLYILYSPAIVYLLFLFVIVSLKYNKKIFFGIMFFVITILPVIGLLKSISTSDIACRYCYLPYLGLFYLFTEFIFLIYIKSNKLKYIVLTILIFIFIFLGYSSHKRSILWTDNMKFINNEIELFPDTHYLAYLCRGGFYLSENDIEQADRDTMKSYKILGPEDNIIFQIAGIQKMNNKLDMAKYNYSLIHKNNTTYMNAVVNIALIMFYNENKRQEAVELLEDLKNKYKYYPIISGVYFALGKMYADNNDTDKALENFLISLKLDKQNKKHYIEIAKIYEKTGRFDELINLLSDGLKNVKDNMEIYNLLAKFYCEKFDFANAYKIIQECLILYPNNHNAYYFLGNMFALNKNYKQALRNFTMAILLTKDNGQYLFSRAATFMSLNKYELAKKDMEKSLKKGFNIEIENLKKDIEKIKNKK